VSLTPVAIRVGPSRPSHEPLPTRGGRLGHALDVNGPRCSTDAVSLAELSSQTGEAVETLQHWQALGLVGAAPTDRDTERALLVRLCLRRGVPLEALASVERDRPILDRYVDLTGAAALGPPIPMEKAAQAATISLGTAHRIWEATGLSSEADAVRRNDVEAFRAMKRLLDAGFPEDALVEGARVYADSLARVAEMECRSFHIYVHERLRAEGISGDELSAATAASSELAQPIIEPTVLFFHRKGWERALLDDLVLHVAEEAGLLPPPDTPGELHRAVCFVDLSSSTSLATAMGDAAIADVLQRFSSIVRRAGPRFEGRVVKQIGDAFMLVFPGPELAVTCVAEIEALAATEPQFPAVRGGIAWGPVLYREGDYVGTNVNTAARLATEAERHQLLVTADVRKAAADVDGIEFIPLGRRPLKGLRDVELFEARPDVRGPAAKALDPVCGMELAPAEVAARLTREDGELVFCSETCLRAFVAGSAPA
jgi:adenylate cyclase